MKDLISQFRTAQNILLSLNTKRLSFAYLIGALNIVLKEKGVGLKVHCQSPELRSELINLDPFFQDQFVEKIDKTDYTIKLKKDAKDIIISNTISDPENVILKFESDSNDLSLKDFDLVNNSAKCDLLLFLGHYSDKQINSFKNIKPLKKKYLISNKKYNKPYKELDLFFIDSSNIGFFINLIDSIEFNNKHEVYTLLLSSILIETNNLSNSLTPKYLEYAQDLLKRGAVFNIAQNYISKNNVYNLNQLGNALNKFKEISKDVYFCEINNESGSIDDFFINDILYVSRKIKGHKLIILKVNGLDKTTYYLTSRHPRIDLKILKKNYSGSGNKEFYKFSYKGNQTENISNILNLLSIENTLEISTNNKPDYKKEIINPINNTSIRNELPKIEEQIKRVDMNFQNQASNQINHNSYDPLRVATNVPEPIFLTRKNTPSNPQNAGPLPSATV